MLTQSIHKTLHELIDLLNQLTDQVYTTPCRELSNATIGEHTRHCIELFQCLLSQYELGVINYDKRQRDLAIQSQTEVAKTALLSLLDQLDKPNIDLVLEQDYDGNRIQITTTYQRELLYNLDHCVHHQALIKVALLSSTVQIDPNFGVARSTIAYRQQCAQ
ncbi:MAG: DinB family protein [Flavobacterium sp.]|jgi:hypothetical protein|nr:DinB family protein [Flavobacterium sp.]